MLVNFSYGKVFNSPYTSNMNSLYPYQRGTSSFPLVSTLPVQSLNPVNYTSLEFVQGLKNGADDVKQAVTSIQKVRNATEEMDADNALSLVQDLADSYNNLFTLVRDSNFGIKLFDKLIGASKTYAQSLSKLGISFDKKGDMTIDREKAATAAKDGSLKRFFSDRDSGYLRQLARIADDVNYNTGRYVNQNVMLASLLHDIGGYQNMATRYGFLGMLLDYSF